jgi:hypothetical protein
MIAASPRSSLTFLDSSGLSTPTWSQAEMEVKARRNYVERGKHNQIKSYIARGFKP